jgi:hypothetical protein
MMFWLGFVWGAVAGVTWTTLLFRSLNSWQKTVPQKKVYVDIMKHYNVKETEHGNV